MKTTIDLPIRRDVPLADQCGHGKRWTETCPDCEIAWLEAMLPDAERRVQRDRARLNQLLAERG